MPKKIKPKTDKRIDSAMTYLRAGDLQKAALTCQTILQKNPDHAGGLHLMGMILFYSSQPERAIKHIKKAITLYPRNSLYLHDLGYVCMRQGMLNEARASFEAAIQIRKDYAEAYFSLSTLLINQGDIEGAAIQLQNLLKIKPGFAEAHNNLGVIQEKRGELDDAHSHYKEAIARKPDYPEAHNNLGNIFHAKGLHDKASEQYLKALSLKPDYAEAHNNLGNVLRETGSIDDALEHYRRAIDLQPRYATAHNNLGLVLKNMDKYDDAIQSFQTALAIRPDYAEAHNNLSTAFIEKDDIEKSMQHAKEAIRLNPGHYKAYSNLGNIYTQLGMTVKAAEHFGKALSLKPDYPGTHLNLSIMLLRDGNYRDGWKEYEWRFKNDPSGDKKIPLPEWDRKYLGGKRLLITSEQGIGDEIMFASCLPDLIRTISSNCLVECNPRLLPIFKRSFPDLTFISVADLQAALHNISSVADCKISSGSLPSLFRNSIESFPRHRSYLVPDRDSVNAWKKRLQDQPGTLKVGLSWRGGTTPRIINTRSIALTEWEHILSSQDTLFINLQYGNSEDELKEIRDKFGISIFAPDEIDPLKELENFSALIAALDLVITIDNSTAHLAAALGRPVWVLLPNNSEWRWLKDCEDTPWYASLRLVRQKTSGEWGHVLRRVQSDLQDLIESGREPEIPDGKSFKRLFKEKEL